MARRGWTTRLAVGWKRSSAPNVEEIPNERNRSAWARAWRAAARRAAAFGAAGAARGAEAVAEPSRARARAAGREDFEYPGAARLLEGAPAPDLVHLHNLHDGYFDLRVLPALSRKVPVVVSLHDMWLLTGHCAHAFACDRWRTGCGACPDLGIYPAISRDATAENWRAKAELYARSRIHVVASSRWIASRAADSMLRPATMRVIAPGVDRSVFRPARGDDRMRARRRFAIPPDAWTLATPCPPDPRAPWRDMRFLDALVRAVAAKRMPGEPETAWILRGSGGAARFAGSDVLLADRLPGDADLADLYRAADLWIHPAAADTFPYAVLEATACGCPPAATRVGGIPDAIDDGATGLLLDPADPDAAAERILALLREPARRGAIAAAGVRRVEEAYDRERQLDRFAACYEEVAGSVK